MGISGLTSEQIAIRATGIGASEVPMILGESPHGGAIDVYMSKLGLYTEAPSDAKDLGNLLEDGISQWYAQKTGSKVERVDTTLRHCEHDHMLATPDRWIDDRTKILQVKLVGQWMIRHWSAERPPDYVLCQVQQELEVANVELCDVVAVLGGTDPRIYQVVRDRDMGAALARVCTSFWADHVAPRVPPPVDGSDAARRLMRLLYPMHRFAKTIRADDKTSAIGNHLCLSRRERIAIERDEEMLEQQLQGIMGDAEEILSDQWRATWKTNKAGSRVFRFTDYNHE